MVIFLFSAGLAFAGSAGTPVPVCSEQQTLEVESSSAGMPTPTSYQQPPEKVIETPRELVRPSHRGYRASSSPKKELAKRQSLSRRSYSKPKPWVKIVEKTQPEVSVFVQAQAVSTAEPKIQKKEDEKVETWEWALGVIALLAAGGLTLGIIALSTRNGRNSFHADPNHLPAQAMNGISIVGEREITSRLSDGSSHREMAVSETVAIVRAQCAAESAAAYAVAHTARMEAIMAPIRQKQPTPTKPEGGEGLYDRVILRTPRTVIVEEREIEKKKAPAPPPEEEKKEEEKAAKPHQTPADVAKAGVAKKR